MEGFLTILKDFKNDLSITFPELTHALDDVSDACVYEHCLSIIPFFFSLIILYEKESLFDEDRYFYPILIFLY